MIVTTPQKITQVVRDFCSSINPASRPVFVDVRPKGGARPGECFVNVKSQVERRGGRIVYGWTIWLAPDLYIEAEHHAVHGLQDGRLVDATPHVHGETRVLFLPDEAKEYDWENGRRRDNIRLSLSDNPVVQKYLDHAAEMAAFIEQHSKGRQVEFSESALQAKVLGGLPVIQEFMNLAVHEDSRCTCGSGKAVKRCCGLETARSPLNGMMKTAQALRGI